ncbi:MAG: hypothetical protein IT376_13305 [Polyangiaceae bacterium]|nr:hypothetical protein [Polyangiaceae bacterium]
MKSSARGRPVAAWVGAAASVALLVRAAPARAQACCTTTGSSEIGVVGRCHQGLLMAQASYEEALGSFDERGSYRSLEGSAARDATLTLAGGVRPFGPALQLYGALPLRVQQRALAGIPEATRAGAGDATAGARLMALEDRMAGIRLDEPTSLIPFLEPVVAVRLPSGRAPADSRTPSQADVTGEGAYALLGGVSIVKFLTLDESLSVTATYGHRFAHRAGAAASGSRRYEPGAELDAKLAFFDVVDLHWSWTAFATGRWTAAAASDGRPVPASETRRIRVGIGGARYLTYPTWQLTASVAADPPVSGLSQGIPFAGASLALGLRRSFPY